MAGLQDTFYRCFIEDNRWRYLTKGLGNTLLITFFALLIGVLLGVVGKPPESSVSSFFPVRS